MKIDRDAFDQLVAEGWLTCHKHPTAELYLYNYTKKTQFEQHWTPETLMSRGLIVNAGGDVRALPFKKFFNYGETLPRQDLTIVEATEKMDGSLGILYWAHNEPCIATRGSFVSDQAVWATEWIQQRMFHFYTQSLTLLFEIIYPQNRVVVDYGDYEGLVLIGGIEPFFGRDLLYGELEVIANEYHFEQPKVYRMDNIRDYLNATIALSANQEGWVLRYNNGERYKIKGDAYKVAHKLMTGINFNRVLEAISTGAFAGWVETMPEEFLINIREYEAQINQVVADTLARTADLYTQAPKGSRKEFALWVRSNCGTDGLYLFALMDGKPIEPLIYKHEFVKEESPS